MRRTPLTTTPRRQVAHAAYRGQTSIGSEDELNANRRTDGHGRFITLRANVLFIFELNAHRGTRGHPLKLFYPDARVSVRAHCFPIRVIVLRNRLPASVVLAENIQMFKKLLKHVDYSYAVFGKA